MSCVTVHGGQGAAGEAAWLNNVGNADAQGTVTCRRGSLAHGGCQGQLGVFRRLACGSELCVIMHSRIHCSLPIMPSPIWYLFPYGPLQFSFQQDNVRH